MRKTGELFLNTSENIKYINISFPSIFSDPDNILDNISTFLGIKINNEEIKKIIDKELYRNQNKST